ncbi:polymer-forming cytoskeletal protein [Cytobacillus firmus]|uniref:polymer-forming cytoskeletal protein n=1 Tax=Cytobacillus firmus TaxID=1399 RepID=UPI002161EDAC|nr:polymer-forming cytoskeletal protein [Cytobacillus firmus]MCS0671789.1 polymer-forming cytoskeletal protein [Cytobacillus firmus]
MKTLGNLIINGVGSSNGGTYQKVELNGKGTVNSDIECERFHCNGTGTVHGNIKTEKGKISGAAKIHGAVKAESLVINGSAVISEAVGCQKLEIAGRSSIGGSVKCDVIAVNGKATIEGDCEAEVFRAEGTFSLDGLLNAETIDIKLFGDSKAKGGRKIKVTQHRETLLKLIKSIFPLKLEAVLIEGDDIELEGTAALVVRGKNVKIGKNCEIGLVEYSGDYDCSPEAEVKELRRI